MDNFVEDKLEHVPKAENMQVGFMSKLTSINAKGRYKSLLEQLLTSTSIKKLDSCM